MENTVATPAVEAGFGQDDAAQFENSADLIDVGTLMQEDTEPTVATAESVATVQQPQDDAASGKGHLTQADFDRILGQRLGSERTKYESSPEYMLGQQLIRERAAREGITADEAYRRIQNDHVQQKAEQYAKDPKAFYADYLTQQNTPTTPTQQTYQQPPADAATLTQQLVAAGAMDMGFQPQHITPQFAADAQKYGVQTALLLWQRGRAPSQDAIVAQLEQRKRTPQPMRPMSNGASSPTRDYTNMSSDEFKKLEARLKQATLDGRRVKL